MTNKKRNFIMKFDCKETTYEESKRGILDLIRLLQRSKVESMQDCKDIPEDELELLKGLLLLPFTKWRKILKQR